MSSFIFNIRFWGSGRNCAFDSEKNGAATFLRKFPLEIQPYQISLFMRDAIGVHI